MVNAAMIMPLVRNLPPPDMRLPSKPIDERLAKAFRLQPAPYLKKNKSLNPLRAPIPLGEAPTASQGFSRYTAIADLVQKVEANRPAGVEPRSWISITEGISARQMAEGLLGHVAKLEAWMIKYGEVDHNLRSILAELIEALRKLKERKAKRKRVT